MQEMNSSCFCARYGGEEFAIILSDTGVRDATEVAEQLRKEFEAAEFKTEEVIKNFSISVGVAESKMEYAHGKDVFLQADAQLYRAKQNGRNQVCCE